MLKFHVPDKDFSRASLRLRATNPAKIFGEIISNPQEADTDDVIVFAKKSTINDIRYAVENNIKFIFDICDDQFEDNKYKELFSYACKHCDAITVPTDRMKSLCEQKTSKKSYKILESYERESKPPQFNPGDILNILFYGTYDNFDAVPWIELINQLKKNDIRFKINALVNCASGRKINSPNIEVHEWSFEKHTSFLDECDIVLLPFKNNEKNISTKSPNRVVEAINRGKYVVTNYGVNSYEELQDFIFLDDYDKIVEGIIWTLSNKKLVIQKISEGQKFIHQKYNLASVSDSWRHVYETLLGEKTMTNELVSIIKKYDMNGFRGRYDNSGKHLGGWGTDKDEAHSYCDYYEEMLTPYKERDVSLLEIGTNYGCSAILWHDFLPKSKMLLLDIQETMNSKCWNVMDNDRFTYANCDAYDEETPSEVKNLFPDGFDIIFDDGPHTLESQKECIELYLPMLNNNGTMFIEDIQRVDDFDELQKTFDEVKETLDGNYSCERIDLRHIKNRYDDLIFVVKRIDE